MIYNNSLINAKSIKSILENNSIDNNAVGWFNNNQKTETLPYIYKQLFKNIPLHTHSDISLSTGIEINQISEIQNIGFIKINEQFDISFDSKTKKMKKEIYQEIWAHLDGYILSFDISNEIINDTNNNANNYKTILEKIYSNKKEIKKNKDIKNKDIKNKDINHKETINICKEIELFMPSPLYRKNSVHENILEQIWNIIGQNETDEVDKNEKSEIYILVKDSYETYFKPFDVSKFSPEITALNTFYGEGFSDFNTKLQDKLKTTNKGLVLLHGDPGTGKTYYIKYLLKNLTKNNKRVIFIPSALIEELANPETINFLIEDIINSNKDTILLMEDAEFLLESRKNGNSRSIGISNLLNSTDGILNDLLGIIVIATFNTKLENIDEALLRTGRLIARKNFKPVDYNGAIAIAKELGIEKSFIKTADRNKMYTITDILDTGDKDKIIVHDIDIKNKIGFK